jgi:hypothetical protein
LRTPHALEGLYPVRREGDENIGLHYLEKMLQTGISIPPLAEPEAQTKSTFVRGDPRLYRV